MNIHEYQAKEIFKKYGIPVSEGRLAKSAPEAREAFQALGKVPLVIKAQVHAGGRGKAGGIKFGKTAEEVEKAAGQILGLKLKTKQTGGLEKTVRSVWVERSTNIAKEFYLGVTVDREAGLPIIIFSPAGGMSIEEVAEKNPEQIFRLHFDPDDLPNTQTIGVFVSKAITVIASPEGATRSRGVSPRNNSAGQDARPTRLSLPSAVPRNDVSVALASVIDCASKLFVSVDASLVEINPLAITGEGSVVAVDAKITLDDNALFRHPDLEALRDPLEEDPREQEARKHDLSYVGLSGNIGCMVNGAGLAMATMDIIKLYGAEPANFLDVGGGATAEKISAAFKILLADKNVKAILINIFGGIVRCDLIAEGILAALKSVRLNIPLVVRLEGTNADQGKALLEKSGIKLMAASGLAEAAEKVVKAVR